MTTLARGAVLAAGLLAAQPVAWAEAGIPARIRVLKGSRQGPAEIAPVLRDLSHQLSHTAYVRWEEAGELTTTMEFKKPVPVAVPGGLQVVVTLLESRRDTATYEVLVPATRTHSRLTIPKDKRIVQQVTPERGGEAYFVTIRPWP
ncbi:MAG TPA: hypothetical protein VMT17_08055 [Anaeromyxobacteraceae bacterium]|nr:hypothetical protein [Anaeromyxobacteraceae bacterium]